MSEVAVGEIEQFGLDGATAGALIGSIATIGVSTTTTGACQYSKAKEILSNIANDKRYYKYLPAIIFPHRVTQDYVQKFPFSNVPLYGNLNVVKQLASVMVRHGLVVSTVKKNKPVYVYIGGLPKAFLDTNILNVAQGGAVFTAKAYKKLFSGIDINPEFGIVPLIVRKNKKYYTNPPISQGGNGKIVDVVGIFNFVASILEELIGSTFAFPAIEYNQRHYVTYGATKDSLIHATQPYRFADTPSLHVVSTGILLAPSMPDSTNLNTWLQNIGYYSIQPFNNSVKGSPVYVTSVSINGCTELMLRGFVGSLDPVFDTFTIDNITVSPGLAYGNIISPPNSWNYNDLLNWAITNGNGIPSNIWDKWFDMVLFESDVVTQLINSGYENLVDIVHQYFDPAPEVVEQGVDNIVSGITNAVSSGVNSVINFLKSL